ncbi:MAG: DUF2059 domain-containing protein [Acidobacteria bacterium]|nr:MAG: DUF2059 domain-containing protein [Acidobacteriota bacterium]REK02316.1 MAG: DUF2059 domain-containing protein [Acidobacteriota bacterium]REK13881.1 MAG: DUF2059 domain-containing protein [Acidobacteriota bacterium]REK41875.1 MAG: DUF2059 domain-containing protein [Acidobacteriota bacterium]
MKKYRAAAGAVLLLLIFSGIANAQQDISDSKRKLINDFLEATDIRNQIEGITDSMLRSMEITYPLMVQDSLEGSDLTEAEKNMMSSLIEESYVAFSERFRERLPGSVDFGKYIDDVIVPLYDRHFTENEIRELVDFYRTPTGKKLIRITPQLTDESLEIAREYLTPKLMKLAKEVLEETFPKFEDGTKNGPPPPPAPKKDG